MPTSHGFVPHPREGEHILNPFEPSENSAFVHNFNFVGTMDNGPYLSVPDAIAYRESIGGEAAIYEYCHELNAKASKRTAEMLKTEVMENEEGTLTKCGMSMVRLPVDVAEVQSLLKDADIEMEEYDIGTKVRDFLTMRMARDHNTFMALTVLYANAWWVRLSTTVYLDEADFEKGAEILLAVCKKLRTGDFVTWVQEKQKKA